jgi:hypothetical protein
VGCIDRSFTAETAEDADERRIYRQRMGAGNGWELETDGIWKRTDLETD